MVELEGIRRTVLRDGGASRAKTERSVGTSSRRTSLWCLVSRRISPTNETSCSPRGGALMLIPRGRYSAERRRTVLSDRPGAVVNGAYASSAALKRR